MFRCQVACALWLVASLSTEPSLLAANLGGPLLAAAREDHSAAVAALVERGADVNWQEPDGSTALAWAAVRGNAEVATALLRAGADPDLANALGIGPLALAIENGATEVARLLLGSGADPNVARESGETPLMMAARTGQIDLMRLLLERGADVNARERKFGQTALMWAAGSSEAVRLLVEKGAATGMATMTWDVEYTIYIPTTFTLGKTGIPWNSEGTFVSKRGGQTALLFAVQKRDLESARVLADAGLDVNQPAADGTTPLLSAMYKWVPLEDVFVPGRGAPALSGSSQRFAPDLAMARFLLDRGASVTAADTVGYTPLHGAALAVAWAARSADKKGKSEYRRNQALVMLNHENNGPPPFSAEDALKMVKRLLEGGADPNRQTVYPTPGPAGDVRINPAPAGSAALHIAASSGSVALVRLLAEAGGDPNLVRKDGHTPLTVAVVAGDLPVVKELVAQGADLEARYDPDDKLPDPDKAITLSRKRQTVTHIAAAGLLPGMVEYLHSQGAPIDWRNGQGETPLDLADHQERFHESLDRQNTDGDAERLKAVKRRTETSDAIRKILVGNRESGAPDSSGTGE